MSLGIILSPNSRRLYLRTVDVGIRLNETFFAGSTDGNDLRYRIVLPNKPPTLGNALMVVESIETINDIQNVKLKWLESISPSEPFDEIFCNKLFANDLVSTTELGITNGVGTTSMIYEGMSNIAYKLPFDRPLVNSILVCDSNGQMKWANPSIPSDPVIPKRKGLFISKINSINNSNNYISVELLRPPENQYTYYIPWTSNDQTFPNQSFTGYYKLKLHLEYNVNSDSDKQFELWITNETRAATDPLGWPPGFELISPLQNRITFGCNQSSSATNDTTDGRQNNRREIKNVNKEWLLKGNGLIIAPKIYCTIARANYNNSSPTSNNNYFNLYSLNMSIEPVEIADDPSNIINL